MARIACIGSLSWDITVVPETSSFGTNERLISFVRGSKVYSRIEKTAIGGSAYNCAATLKNANHAVTITSQIGRDMHARFIARDVATRFRGSKLLKSSSATPSSIILICDQDRTILTDHFDSQYDQWSLPDEELDWILLGPIHGKADVLYREINKHVVGGRTRLCVVPSMFQIKEDRAALLALLRVTDLFVCNLEESKALTFAFKEPDPRQLASTIQQFGPLIVSITMGKSGAVIKSGEYYYQAPVTNDHLVDATGAGDAFTSAVVAVLAHSTTLSGAVLETALKCGIINSNQVIQEYGASSGMLDKKQFRHFLID